ncbi:hypothetical protein KEM56_000108 [Ascosphaera pollenicola]|nr:hypothetical protein KEM56_000108 [Ascosphaera pollenicola]
MSSATFQQTYSDEFEALFGSLGMSDPLDQKQYLFEDHHPFYPLGPNIDFPFDTPLFETQPENVWDSFLPASFHSIDDLTLPNSFINDMDMFQGTSELEQAPAEPLKYDQSDFLPFVPFEYEFPNDPYQYAGKHPSEFEVWDSRLMDAVPTLPPQPSSEELAYAAHPIDPANHPPAKRLRSSRSRDSKGSPATMKSSSSKPKVKKASSFNGSGSSSSRSLRRTRAMAKSRSVPHMAHDVTSAPHGTQFGDNASLFASRERFEFVNYTMEDGDELLAAVAPSGTLKTRARREQEAREEARRLEEAALAAIRLAGGDPRDLEMFMR